ncbi:Uncharacterised protein [Mycobacteroides abscessus subsp. abscessus]|nr:Uncharacterised protein [Mycobacteroides abscessus subsp. abscessus]
MLDDDDRRSALNEVLEHVQEDLHIIRVQADRRLVEDEESALLAPTHFGGKLEALGLATREGGSGFPQRQVSQAEAGQSLQDRSGFL